MLTSFVHCLIKEMSTLLQHQKHLSCEILHSFISGTLFWKAVTILDWEIINFAAGAWVEFVFTKKPKWHCETDVVIS